MVNAVAAFSNLAGRVDQANLSLKVLDEVSLLREGLLTVVALVAPDVQVIAHMILHVVEARCLQITNFARQHLLLPPSHRIFIHRLGVVHPDLPLEDFLCAQGLQTGSTGLLPVNLDLALKFLNTCLRTLRHLILLHDRLHHWERFFSLW